MYITITIYMKKFSVEYYKEKFLILWERLRAKEGFEEEIARIRAELGIPEDGFSSDVDLAYFLIDRLNDEEQESFPYILYIPKFESKNQTFVKSEEDFDELYRQFDEEIGEENFPRFVLQSLLDYIKPEADSFTSFPLMKLSEENSKLKPICLSLSSKFFSFDLLDELIIFQFIERYLFLGENGVIRHIDAKVTCTCCRHIGVKHFSPNASHMQGREDGVFSKDYIFNEGAVRLLSQHVHSLFLIIKPYSTKQQIIKYVEENWDSLKQSLDEKNKFYIQAGVKIGKLKKRDNNKNRLVYELSKESKKDLEERYKALDTGFATPRYKDSIISAILKHEFAIDMSSDAVKKSYQRYAKSDDLMKNPKDIRDI